MGRRHLVQSVIQPVEPVVLRRRGRHIALRIGKPGANGEGNIQKFQILLFYSAPIRIRASSELPSRITVFSLPVRLCFKASRARVNS